jgi:hypothetical protein
MSKQSRRTVNVLEPLKHPGARLARALKNSPGKLGGDVLRDSVKLKKDGTPYTPWSDEVALRLKKKEERKAAGLPEKKGKRCKAMTTGVHGPKRPCDRHAVKGLDVCYVHGGSTKAAKEAARRRLVDELDPTISRLIEIRDQDMHMPSALGAATQIMNRVMGKPDSVDKDKGAGKPTINIGIGIAGIPRAAIQAQITDGETVETVAVEVKDEA